jgi:predicted negative regulator of RcsB-dependent stress response
MDTLDAGETNIFEREAVNWRLIVYPLAAVIAALLIGLGIYYYVLNERLTREASAQDALALAKTPDDFVKVADDFPGTTHATVALMSAADASYEKKDFAGAIKDYQRVTDDKDSDATLRDSAQLGLAASLAASGKVDDAIKAYMTVAERNGGSGFAPFAYNAVARIYEDKGDKDNERRVLAEAANLGTDSPFGQVAAQRLKALDQAAPTVITMPAATNAPAAKP